MLVNSSDRLVLGIDASRNRSGGAKAYLKGILCKGDLLKYHISEVHLWSYQSLLDSIPDFPWLIKHNPRELEQSLFKQLWWQFTKLSREIESADCNILFTTDASTLCNYQPMVVLSQDLLSYEAGLMNKYSYTKARIRLLTILLLQNRAFQSAAGVIFLTKYAAKVIQKSCGPLSRIAVIHHGVEEEFKCAQPLDNWPIDSRKPVRSVYVSNSEMHKHQAEVVKAIEILRERGFNISLTLVGGGVGKAQRLLVKQMVKTDPSKTVIQQLDFIKHEKLPKLLTEADIFIFASSCEAFGITLLEAMSVGMPIACSNRSCIPELIIDGCVYFDPEDSDSIADAIAKIIMYPVLRANIAQRSKKLAKQYSWTRCSDETWEFISETYKYQKIKSRAL